MEEYKQWLEQQIERCLNDKDLQREHWAFCKAYEKFTALRQPPVSGQSEQLKALMHFAEFAKEEYGLHIPLNLIKEYVKAFNCH